MTQPGILLVSRNFPPLVGGMERLNHHVLLELDKEYDVTLVGPNGAEAYVTESRRAVTCPSNPVPGFLACASLQAIRVARRLRPRLILAGSGVNAPPAWLAAGASGARWGVYLHGLDIVVDNAVYRHIFLPIIRRADFWLANSGSTVRAATEAGLDPGRVHLLHPGVALPIHLPDEAAVSAWRQQRDLGMGPILLSVGRLTRRKGLKAFILHTFRQILSDWPDALLVVIGSEAKEAVNSNVVSFESLRQAAIEIGALANLRILGRVADEELALAYHAASVHIFPVLDIPGDMEGFGMVAIEAAAHGTPTIAFNVGGVADAVMPGQSGDLVTPGDYTAMAERAGAWLRKGKSAESSDTARAFAGSFSWSIFGPRLRELCHQVLND